MLGCRIERHPWSRSTAPPRPPVARRGQRASPSTVRVDETIYYSPAAFATHRLRFGDFAPIVVMAHEWGHHVQSLLGIVPQPGNAFELQADCLAGAYASQPRSRGCSIPATSPKRWPRPRTRVTPSDCRKTLLARTASTTTA